MPEVEVLAIQVVGLVVGTWDLGIIRELVRNRTATWPRQIDHQYVKVNVIEAVGIVGVFPLLYLNLSAFNDTHCTIATVHTVDVRIS